MEVEWRRLRADQLRERAKQDAIVILPVGSLEQHGPHLPVEIDSLLGEAVALRTARLASATDNLIVLRCFGPAFLSITCRSAALLRSILRRSSA
jgi:creatinine amidohydrolase